MNKFAKLIPLGNRVLVKADNEEEVTNSGIYLAKNKLEEERIKFGTVITSGSEVTLVHKKDKIMFDRYSAVHLDDEYMILKEPDIIAVK